MFMKPMLFLTQKIAYLPIAYLNWQTKATRTHVRIVLGVYVRIEKAFVVTQHSRGNGTCHFHLYSRI